MDYFTQVDFSKGKSRQARKWFNGSLTDQEIESPEEVIEKIKKQSKKRQARTHNQTNMEKTALTVQDQSKLNKQHSEEMGAVRATIE